MRRRTMLCIVAAVSMTAAAPVTAQPALQGEVAFPNSGAPGAQPAFLEGLAELHNFEYGLAAASFRRAQQADPDFAMAYWGEAMTYNHPVWMQQDREAAVAALKRLASTRETRVAKAKTDRERDYLGAVEVLYGDGDKYARDAAYSDAMAAVHRKYPDDVDATAFYALSLLGTAHHGRDFAIYMKSAALLEPEFQKHPNHPGVAHYLIHSYDDPIHAPLGLRAARAYSKIAPSSSHAQHMCSHIFVAMGLWDDVVSANEAAVAVTNRGLAAHGQPPAACGHYPSWLEYGYVQEGRISDARKVLADCYARAAAAKAPATGAVQPLDPDASSVGSFATMRARFLLDTEDWGGEVASWHVQPGRYPADLTTAFVDGFAAARTGRVADAQRALDELKRDRATIEDALTRAHADEATERGRMAALEAELTSAIEAAEGRTSAAIATARAAAEREEKLPFEFGPPFIDKPAYELLGELRLSAGDAPGARDAFERSLARTPERVLSLKGLMHAAEAAGDRAKAGEIRARLATILHRADPAAKTF